MNNVPVGTNFVLVGYGFAVGNVLLDPVLPIEGLDSRVNTILGAYVRAIDVFGLSGKVDVIATFAGGDWKGLVAGEERVRLATGFGDPRVRLSVNFLGSPALRRSELAAYQAGTVAGASLQVIVPVGQYDPTKLLNLGSNRWVFRPQVGIAQAFGPWAIEGYGSAWLFTDNPDFFGGLELRQRPLWTMKVHLVRTLTRGIWLAGDVGYAAGGRGIVNGVLRETQISTLRYGATLALPVGPDHALKVTVASTARGARGPAYDGVAVTYQYRWYGES